MIRRTIIHETKLVRVTRWETPALPRQVRPRRGRTYWSISWLWQQPAPDFVTTSPVVAGIMARTDLNLEDQ